MSVCVVTPDRKPLMPTSEYRARRLLKSGKAVIYRHRPFTIMLTRVVSENVQPIEYCCDTGYQHIGVSIKSEYHEYFDGQFDMLYDEKKRHDDKRKYRRTRRNRLRYRKPRFDNRCASKKKGWLAPSLRNVRDQHIRIFERFKAVMPITSATFEMGSFDVHAMHEFEETGTVLKGEDYQKGPRYGLNSLRKAVFQRDGHTCQVCGKSIHDGAVLRVHHLGYLKGDHSNRMSNLLTVCTKCHTASNHKPGGKLYGLKPKARPFMGAAFMNSVRWQMFEALKNAYPDVEWHMTYGAATQAARKARSLEKSHANDAYAMGRLHPGHRSSFQHFKKLRRNNRILEKFYDAKYIDCRDGKKKKGSELSCGRTNRSEPRRSDKNLRIYRALKVSRGRRSVRRKHYDIQPYDRVVCNGNVFTAKGMHCRGARIMLGSGKSVPKKSVSSLRYAGGYALIPD